MQPDNLERQADAQPSRLARLWRGEYGLLTTYWVIGIGVGLPIGCVAVVLRTLSASLESVFLIVTVFWAWQLVIGVGVWRAASKYVGNRAWPLLAKLSILISVFQLYGVSIGLIGNALRATHGVG
jgi:hypothetical protein